MLRTVTDSIRPHPSHPSYPCSLFTRRLTHAALRLLRDGLRVERRLEELLRGLLRVVEVAAGLDRLLVLVDGAPAVAHRVVGVAALDVRPRLDPRGLPVAVQRG